MKKALNNIGIAALFVLLVVVMGYRLWFPPDPYFDEMHYVKFMKALLYENTYNGYASQHPPLWNILMALCVEIFGDRPFGWRLVSFIAHGGVLALTFKLAKKITKDVNVAWLAFFFLLFDCVSLTQARIAMMNSTMLLFVLLSIYFFLDGFPHGKSYNHGALRKAGIFWAFAITTKMVSINLAFFFIPLLLMELPKRPADRMAVGKDLLIYFVLFPVMLMWCVFIFVPFLTDRTAADIWGIQAFNMHYHATTTQTHGYSSRWWSWPLLLRPICYYYQASQWDSTAATCRVITAIGNPVLFWTIPITTGYVLWQFIRRRSRVFGIVLLGFLSQWLSFGFGNRIQFFHYIYQVMPFIAMMTALFVWKIYNWGRWGRIIAVIYLLAVAGMFAYWYPILTGLEISRTYFYQHMWFRSWI